MMKKFVISFVMLSWLVAIVLVWFVPGGVMLSIYGKYIADDVVWNGFELPKIDGYFVYPKAKPEYVVIGKHSGNIFNGVDSATITVSSESWDGYGHGFKDVVYELCRTGVECVEYDVEFMSRELTMTIPTIDGDGYSGYIFEVLRKSL